MHLEFDQFDIFQLISLPETAHFVSGHFGRRDLVFGHCAPIFELI